MLNKIIIMGRFTKDPELKRTPNGSAVTSFTLAVERDFKEPDGSKKVDFIDVVAWRNTAEFICKYWSKGRSAVVEGKLQIRNWEDQDGNRHRNAEVKVDNIYFADSKKTENKATHTRSFDNSFQEDEGFEEVEGYEENPFFI